MGTRRSTHVYQAPRPTLTPEEVYSICCPVMLGGEKMVFDPDKSHGSIFHDALAKRDYIDCFSFYASQSLGHNHPAMSEPAFERQLLRAAKYKPANPDMYTNDLAESIHVIKGILPPAYRKLVFFISGGSAAIENALKAAMDAKVQENLEAGRGEIGTDILHFENAFHGRGGYTLSITNTDPKKVKHFAKFSWPRVPSPERIFPETAEQISKTIRHEEQSIAQIKQVIAENPHGIAALIIEPIQAEGGDRHFRPEFLRALRTLCTEAGIYFIVDEVQCGMGLTGDWWMSEHDNLQPDMLVFGKKMQVCGFAARDDFRAGKPSVFNQASRINSTWGGSLVDYVRVAHVIETIQKNDYLANVRTQGQFLLNGLEALQNTFAHIMNHARGRGLMCSFDLKDTATRDLLLKKLRAYGAAQQKPGIYLLARGPVSVGFRPYLDVEQSTLTYLLDGLKSVLQELS